MKLFFSFMFAVVLFQPLFGMERQSKLNNLSDKIVSLVEASDKFVNNCIKQLKRSTSNPELVQKNHSQSITVDSKTFAILHEIEKEINQINNLPESEKNNKRKEELLLEKMRILKEGAKNLYSNISSNEEAKYKENPTEIEKRKKEEENRKIALAQLEKKINVKKQGDQAYYSGIKWSIFTFAGSLGTFLSWKYRFPKKVTYSLGATSLFCGFKTAHAMYVNWLASKKLDELNSQKI
jgi:hypothetical protein